MTEKIEHPHIHVDGVCGPAGELFGQIHECCPRGGITFQCGFHEAGRPPCGHVATYTWAELDAYNEPLLEHEATELVCLPPCPKCGALTQFGHNDIEYGSDLPEYHTMRAIREHVVGRKAFRNLQRWEASRTNPSHPGRDFSHLPKRKRPDHHCVVDVAAEPAEQKNAASPRIMGDTDA